MAELKNKRILMIIGGGIAAYKALELIRRLKDQGARVRAILTGGGAQFITPLSVASLTGEKVFSDLFSLTDETEMGHIRLSREADLLLVVPATANLLAKMAHGIADDLASTTLLATNKPVMAAPAMNVEMWAKPSTMRNIRQLRQDGVMVIEPAEGELACGEVGVGRLPEVDVIRDHVIRHFKGHKGRLDGLRALVTAGPTHEPIDPVRYIANRSSGKQGYAIAGAFARFGAETVLVSGPTHLETPQGVDRIDVETAREMWRAVQKNLPYDVAVCSAAVSDWGIDKQAGQKIKKESGADQVMTFKQNPDILADLAISNRRPRLVIGFAAETENLLENAREKRLRKNCDWIIANDVSAATGIMGGNENTVHVITGDGEEAWPKASKEDVALRLVEKIAGHLESNP
ncbi:MAG: bifunctional phosphopantothenoylcysteine decarboxylase/phosphopantothenate--cysteine ligase CoaBC [Proteobacteria bacterium]|nr:bifunctional phosphopantothenoylcysteine decarboxylase/phosphopantothenate--cysteine ligase CoaBC [Pseudomonadota bacterium]